MLEFQKTWHCPIANKLWFVIFRERAANGCDGHANEEDTLNQLQRSTHATEAVCIQNVIDGQIVSPFIVATWEKLLHRSGMEWRDIKETPKHRWLRFIEAFHVLVVGFEVPQSTDSIDVTTNGSLTK